MSKAKSTSCFDQEYLQSFLAENLSESDEAEVQLHIDSCSQCQKTLEQAAADQSMWDGLRNHLTFTHLPEESLTDDSRLQRLIEYLAPTDDPEMLGRLGSYEVIGLIGQGSTGIVIKALERRLNRFVAIKVLSPMFSSNGAARRRFEREGRAVAAVSHQHVVPIYAVDEFRGLPYIVMQYIPGVSLLQRIEKEGPLNTCEVTRIGLQVAKGLAAAHAQGIVHRDVKPANVILEDTVDRAMVTDFGLARVADEASMTRSGTIAGTPQYMSPEQAKGEAVDPRSDLFSLGSLMYAASTGRPPFRAETLFGVINRVCKTDPRPIREINPEIDEWLEAFVNRLISKQPEDRFQSAIEVESRLAEELAFLQDPASAKRPNRKDYPTAVPLEKKTPASQPKSRVRWLAIAGAILVATAALFSYPGNGNRALALLGIGDKDPQETSAPFVPEEAKVSWQSNEEAFDTNQTPVFDQKWVQSFKASENGKLVLDFDQADILLRPSELSDRVTLTMFRRVVADSQAEAKMIVAKHDLKVTEEADQLTLTGKIDEAFAKRDQGKTLKHVLIRISVPRKFQANIETRSGDIEIGALVGDVEATTFKGDIDLALIQGQVKATATGGDIGLREGCQGKADLMTINGDAYIAKVAGKCDVLTSGGDVWLGENSGEVRAQTSGGDIHVDNLLGKTSVHSCGGNVILNLSADPTEDCRLGATNGNIVVKMLSDVAAEVQVRGKVQPGQTYTSIKADEDDKSDAPWQQLVRNDGGKRIRVSSSTGTIDVQVIEPNSESLGGSGGLGGSGALTGRSKKISAKARAKTSGSPRPGAIATVSLSPNSNLDGYTLYLPESHGQEKKAYPILVYLQGGLGVGGPIERVNQWGLIRLIRDENDLSSERNRLVLDTFIVITPHIKEGQYYSHAKEIEGIVKDVAEKYNGDMTRVSLTGLSRGGHGAWGLASRLPHLFAAIVPIAGSAESVKDFGEIAQTSIWIAHNTGDRVIDFSEAENAVKKMEKATQVEFLKINQADPTDSDFINRKHILTAPKTDSHDAWTDMYTRVELYRWLLRQKRSPKIDLAP